MSNFLLNEYQWFNAVFDSNMRQIFCRLGLILATFYFYMWQQDRYYTRENSQSTMHTIKQKKVKHAKKK